MWSRNYNCAKTFSFDNVAPQVVGSEGLASEHSVCANSFVGEEFLSQHDLLLSLDSLLN